MHRMKITCVNRLPAYKDCINMQYCSVNHLFFLSILFSRYLLGQSFLEYKTQKIHAFYTYNKVKHVPPEYKTLRISSWYRNHEIKMLQTKDSLLCIVCTYHRDIIRGIILFTVCMPAHLSVYLRVTLHYQTTTFCVPQTGKVRKKTSM